MAFFSFVVLCKKCERAEEGEISWRLTVSVLHFPESSGLRPSFLVINCNDVSINLSKIYNPKRREWQRAFAGDHEDTFLHVKLFIRLPNPSSMIFLSRFIPRPSPRRSSSLHSSVEKMPKSKFPILLHSHAWSLTMKHTHMYHENGNLRTWKFAVTTRTSR